MLKTTLKAPRADKITTGIIGACNSASEIAEAIHAFWGSSTPGSDEKFILNKLAKLSQQSEPSEDEINGFTGMTIALMGKSLKSAKKQMFMGSSMLFVPFVNEVGNTLGVSWFTLENERVWKFIFVSGDYFRIRPALIAWRNAKAVEERDAAALRMRAILGPLQESNLSLKGSVVTILTKRVGDLLNGRLVNIFQTTGVSTEQPNPLTITQEQADHKQPTTRLNGNALLNSLSQPAQATCDDAKQLVASYLDPKNTMSFEWLNIRTMFGDAAENVKDALVSGRVGFGPANSLNGCQNYLQRASSAASGWLKGMIKIPVDKVAPVIDEMRSKFLDASAVEDDAASEWVNGIKISKMLVDEYDAQAGKEGAFIQDLKDVFRLAGGKIKTLKVIELNRDRSFASQGKRLISLNPAGGKKTLWHEVGHHFEFTNPDYLKMALAYLSERVNGNNTAIKPLKYFFQSHYADSEIAIADALSSPYVGKIYGSKDVKGAGSTEVFSSGFEYLAKSESGAVSLLNDDQLMQFVAGILKEVHGL